MKNKSPAGRRLQLFLILALTFSFTEAFPKEPPDEPANNERALLVKGIALLQKGAPQKAISD
jgi:hypothetical protein